MKLHALTILFHTYLKPFIFKQYYANNTHGQFQSNYQPGLFNSPKQYVGCPWTAPSSSISSTSLEPKLMAISGLTTPKTTICMLFKYKAITHNYNTHIRHTRTIFSPRSVRDCPKRVPKFSAFNPNFRD